MPDFQILCANDQLIQRLVPHYAEIVSLMVRLLPSDKPAPKVLDLGSGSGRISEAMSKRFPEIELTLLDATAETLDLAGERLAGTSTTFVHGDFTTADLGTGYDAIVAGLTLHHLDDTAKQGMLGRLWNALSGNGTLIISDIVRGSTDAWNHRYEAMWLEHIADLPAQQHDNVLQHYREQDHPTRVEDQLGWLEAAGFTQVACHWRHLNFAVWTGQKQMQP